MLFIDIDRIINILENRKVYQILNFLIFKFNERFDFFKKTKVFYLPPHISIFPSYDCTLSCKMCLTHSSIIPDNPYKYKGAKMMSFELFKDIITRYRTTWNVSFIGNGEPLLNKDIFKMIDYAFYKMKMTVSLITNGTLIHLYLKDFLTTPLSEVSISVNSFNETDYERITGNPKFFYNLIIENVKKLVSINKMRKKPFKIIISLIVDKKNIKKIKDMITFAESLGVDQLSIYNIMPWFVNELSPEKRALFADDDTLKILKDVRKSRKLDILLPVLLDGKINRFCRDAYYSMSIDGNGNVGGCERMLLNTEKNGKYYEKNVFNNEHFKRMRSLFVIENNEILEPCKICYNNSTYRPILLSKDGC